MANTTNLVFGIKPSDNLDYFPNKEKPCKLYCKPSEMNIFYDFLSKIEDGTKCDPFGYDVCINGFCQVL